MADALARFTDRPVIDMTNFEGHYDFVIELTPEDFHAIESDLPLRPGSR
jgi:uncharacterized protein (TIGR03435 family)